VSGQGRPGYQKDSYISEKYFCCNDFNNKNYDFYEDFFIQILPKCCSFDSQNILLTNPLKL